MLPAVRSGSARLLQGAQQPLGGPEPRALNRLLPHLPRRLRERPRLFLGLRSGLHLVGGLGSGGVVVAGDVDQGEVVDAGGEVVRGAAGVDEGDVEPGGRGRPGPG
ncbi:hypothetical protein GCM10025868_26710 [Angustibacter aerolatus]|uniref:Uncharacterized protein n=1 Tax=Angustibacter aerolatus TaxID=1162965 RepID=A0ABQ6JIP2_9ACTN|nr:hypothetical protein GCM10025868_26710 [Angustibacter aerolatus]